MNEFIISLASLFIGILVTILVSRHYFIKSVKKFLTPYVDFQTSLLSSIAKDVKDSLKIKYKNEEIEDLSEVQYLIANTGQKAIKDVIQPLSIRVPEKGVILDASLLHMSPEERDIKLKFINNNTIQCYFPILNKNEFFIVKLLINGNLNLNDIDFLIAVDDLPPKLKKKNLPRDRIGTTKPNVDYEYQKSMIIIGTILLVFGLSPIYLSYHIDISWENFNGLLVKPMFDKIELIHISQVITMIGGAIIALIGVVFLFSSLFEFRKKEKYIVPNKLKRLDGSAIKPK